MVEHKQGKRGRSKGADPVHSSGLVERLTAGNTHHACSDSIITLSAAPVPNKQAMHINDATLMTLIYIWVHGVNRLWHGARGMHIFVSAYHQHLYKQKEACWNRVELEQTFCGPRE